MWLGRVFLRVWTRHNSSIQSSLRLELSHKWLLYYIISFIEVCSDSSTLSDRSHWHHTWALTTLASRSDTWAGSFEVSWGRLHAAFRAVKLLHQVKIGTMLSWRSLQAIRRTVLCATMLIRDRSLSMLRGQLWLPHGRCCWANYVILKLLAWPLKLLFRGHGWALPSCDLLLQLFVNLKVRLSFTTW